jgi:hypothetical protein
MSMKIYNGYKLPYMSLNRLQEFVTRLRRDFCDLAEDIFNELMAEQMTLLVDNISLYGLDLIIEEYKEKNIDISNKSTPYLTAFWMIMDKSKEYRNSQKLIDKKYDFDCSIVLIPQGRKILALYYGENKKYLSLWNSYKEVQDYHYQDSTDGPEDIPEHEWNKRAKDWDKALPGSGIPSTNGFIVELVKDPPFVLNPNWGKILSYVPDLNTRAATYAKDDIYREKIRHELSKNPDKKPDKDEVSKVFFNTSQWLKSMEAQEAIKVRTEEIKGKLKHKLTEEIFTSELTHL